MERLFFLRAEFVVGSVEPHLENYSCINLDLTITENWQTVKMEIEVQKFVSTKEISKDRAEVREARERVLRDAERKAEARFAREEQAQARGDNKWMLPDLDEQLQK